MIGGMIASSMGAGFIGGIAAGFIAGYGVAFMAAHIRLPQALKGLLPMLILPVLGSLFTGLLMFYLVGAPVRSEEHTSELQSQSNLVCRLLLAKKKKHFKL